MEAVRPARPDDLPRLLELADAAHTELLGERGGPTWSVREAPPTPRDGELRAALDDTDRCVLLGTVDDYPVGYGVAGLERLRNGELLAVVSDVYVEAPFRGVAVGEAVMDRLIAWAREQGCSGIDSLVLPGMRESKNFFERYGMKARALLVHLDLVEEIDEPGVVDEPVGSAGVAP
ncbi:MAG: GNAT family N-acetyltransferase [Acidimicrobiales bacterium]|nr:GNAT family N-acetyltransferase [Acidimicrobiales bacterium]